MNQKTDNPMDPQYWANFWANTMRLQIPGSFDQSGWLDWDNWFSPVTNVTFKGNAALEKAIIEQVASYGTQLGILTEAVLSAAEKTGVETDAMKRLQKVANEIETAKSEHRKKLAGQMITALKQLKTSDPELFDSVMERAGE